MFTFHIHDLVYNSAEDTAEKAKLLISKSKQKCPHSHIVLYAVPPRKFDYRWKDYERKRHIYNNIMKTYCANIHNVSMAQTTVTTHDICHDNVHLLFGQEKIIVQDLKVIINGILGIKSYFDYDSWKTKNPSNHTAGGSSISASYRRNGDNRYDHHDYWSQTRNRHGKYTNLSSRRVGDYPQSRGNNNRSYSTKYTRKGKVEYDSSEGSRYGSHSKDYHTDRDNDNLYSRNYSGSNMEHNIGHRRVHFNRDNSRIDQNDRTDGYNSSHDLVINSNNNQQSYDVYHRSRPNNYDNYQNTEYDSNMKTDKEKIDEVYNIIQQLRYQVNV